MPTNPPTPVPGCGGQIAGLCRLHASPQRHGVLIRPGSWLRGGRAIPTWGCGDVGPPCPPQACNSQPH